MTPSATLMASPDFATTDQITTFFSMHFTYDTHKRYEQWLALWYHSAHFVLLSNRKTHICRENRSTWIGRIHTTKTNLTRNKDIIISTAHLERTINRRRECHPGLSQKTLLFLRVLMVYEEQSDSRNRPETPSPHSNTFKVRDMITTSPYHAQGCS